jgi:hypothetical protein
MATRTELTSGERRESDGQRTKGRASAKLWVVAAIAGMVILGASFKYSPSASGNSANALPAALPQVVVSKPLARDVDTQLGKRLSSWLGMACRAMSSRGESLALGNTNFE